MKKVAVILPALNEADCVDQVVRDFSSIGIRVIVVDNGSTDGTGTVAADSGAEVVRENVRGYGSACLAGIRYLRVHNAPDIVVFADCDGTLDAGNLWDLIDPIESKQVDLVLGRRVHVEPGALPLHQKYGNRLVCLLLRIFYGVKIRDIPPYRAVTWEFLSQLPLSEMSFGFPVETVAQTARRMGRLEEIDVVYYRRMSGRSKVAGSLTHALLAGLTMIIVLLRVRRTGK